MLKIAILDLLLLKLDRFADVVGGGFESRANFTGAFLPLDFIVQVAGVFAAHS